jgi:hypothetical protein
MTTVDLSKLTNGEVVFVNGNFSYFNGKTLLPMNTGIPAANTTLLALTTQVAALAPLASPVLIGVPTAPTPLILDNSTTVSTTAFAQSLLASKISSGGFRIPGITSIAYANKVLTLVLTNGSIVTFGGGVVTSPGQGSLTIATNPLTAETHSSIHTTVAWTGAAPTNLIGTWNNGGGTATITAFTVSGSWITCHASTPSIANTYQLTLIGTGANTATATTTNIAVNAAVTDFPPGIYGPTNVMSGHQVYFYRTLASYFARGLSGPQTCTLTGPDAAQYFVMPGNGFVLWEISNSNEPQAVFNLTVNISDGTTTYSLPITVQNPATDPVATLDSNLVLDSATPDNYWHDITVANVVLWGTGSATFSDPSGLFTYINGGPIMITPGSLASAPFGAYNVTLTPSGGAPYTFPLYIGHEAPPQLAWIPNGGVYTSTPVTNGYGSNQIGTLIYAADSGIRTAQYTSNPTGALNSYNPDPYWGRTGFTYLLNTVSGTIPGVCQVTASSGLTRSLNFNLPVLNGTSYPASNMIGTPVTGLTNFLPTANMQAPSGSPTTVLTLTVNGFTPNWSLSVLDVIDDNCQLTIGLVFQVPMTPRYAISGSGNTATVTAWNLSAINETTPQIDKLQITLTDGFGNYCINTFDITTSWHSYTGPALTCGPGGTWADPGSAAQAIWAAPATYAGATVTFLRGCPNTWSYAPAYTSGGWMPCPIHWLGDPSTQASFTGSISNGAGLAGNILTVSSSTGLFVGDWIATGAAVGTLLLSQIDATHWQVSGSPQLVNAAMTTQIPQIPFDFHGGGGDNQGKGALHCAGGYDTIWERIEVYNARNGKNCGAFYRENSQPGNCTLLHCYAHNSDMGWMNGDYGNHVYIINCLFATCGPGDNGNSHNVYTDGVANLTFTGNYSVDSPAHEFKTRAMTATVTNNFFLEGINWYGSDSPCQNTEGGKMVFSNNVIMKGCDGSRVNNGNIFEWANELGAHPCWYSSVLTADNNIIINTVNPYSGPPNQPPVGWNCLGTNVDPVRGIPYIVNITNTKFYNLAQSAWAGGSYGATAPVLDLSNITTTTLPAGLTLINPLTGGAPFRLPYSAYYLANASGTYDIIMTVPAGSPPGTAVTGGVLSGYDANGDALTNISASISGGISGFSISVSGNTAQLFTNTTLAKGPYVIQVAITGTSITGTIVPSPEFMTVFAI